jgi:multisubunit Na+/H+ antiporter MnhF subunit
MLLLMSRFVDKLSDFIAHRKGLLPLVGIGFITLNLILQFIPAGWLSSSDLMLHIGIILAILGFMLAWAL